jgi:hypothetical protein
MVTVGSVAVELQAYRKNNPKPSVTTNPNLLMAILLMNT